MVCKRSSQGNIVRDKEHGPSFYEVAKESLLDDRFCGVDVERCENIVKEKDLGARIQCASQRYSRLLSTAARLLGVVFRTEMIDGTPERKTLLSNFSLIPSVEELQVAPECTLIEYCRTA